MKQNRKSSKRKPLLAACQADLNGLQTRLTLPGIMNEAAAILQGDQVRPELQRTQKKTLRIHLKLKRI